MIIKTANANAAVVDALARHFVECLRAVHSPDEWRDVVERNDPSTPWCPSHDYTDANGIMLRAFEAVIGREVQFEGPNYESDHALIDKAWSRARRLYFTR